MTVQPEALEKGDALPPSPDPVSDFLRAADAFVAQQHQHGQALTGGNLREVFVLQNEREQAFREIVRSMEQLFSSGKLAGDQLAAVASGLQAVISGEDTLRSQAETRREEVQTQLFSMRRGRGALQGYSVRRGVVPGPRYLSSRT